MTNENEKTRALMNIIKRGSIRHGEILTSLYKAELNQVDADEVIILIVRYKYGVPMGTIGKILNGGKLIIDRIATYASAILGALVLAEIIAIKEFTGSLLEDKLKGIGDNLLFWIGIKKIQISGPEMGIATAKVAMAIPMILIGMALGLVIGYL